MNTRQLSAFVSDRINEHPDVAEFEALRALWNAAHGQQALLELAQRWHGHPRFAPEWETM